MSKFQQTKAFSFEEKGDRLRWMRWNGTRKTFGKPEILRMTPHQSATADSFPIYGEALQLPLVCGVQKPSPRKEKGDRLRWMRWIRRNGAQQGYGKT